MISVTRPSCCYNLSDVSYITYADDLPVLRRIESILALSVQHISMMFGNVDLSLNIDKCEYIVLIQNHQLIICQVDVQ